MLLSVIFTVHNYSSFSLFTLVFYWIASSSWKVNIHSNQMGVQVYRLLSLRPWPNLVQVPFHGLYWVPELVRHL